MASLFPISLADLQIRAQLARDYPGSFLALEGTALWLEVVDGAKQVLQSRSERPLLARLGGSQQPFLAEYVLTLYPADAASVSALCMVLSWLRPALLGLTTSAGFGDRLGLAPPGHVRVLEQVLANAAGGTSAPILAEQSIREMVRTNRTPLDVFTDAIWGAFQASWRGVLGRDVDPLKTRGDTDATVAAGFTFFTIDPGAYVDSEADDAPADVVRRKVDVLPRQDLENDPVDLRHRYVRQRIALEDREVALDEKAVWRATAKYGGAVAHVSHIYRHFPTKGVPFGLEISVDETEMLTSNQEHIYIAQELRRLGLWWVSLTPRYVGHFEKGVNYIDARGVLGADLGSRAAIAHGLSPYKLSLHSGSDKFSLYAITEVARGLVHLKAAGTSYLEALRVVARIDPPFFRDIRAFARPRYEEDRASYHVSAGLGCVPEPNTLPNQRLPELLDDFAARQVLHVTFGSALAEFRPRLSCTSPTDATCMWASLAVRKTRVPASVQPHDIMESRMWKRDFCDTQLCPNICLIC